MSVSLESLMRDPPAGLARSPLLAGLASFLLIGGGAALGFVCLSTLALHAATGVASWLVSALCYAAFIVPVYLLHRRFSFRSDAPHGKALPRYVLVQVSGLLLATGFSWLIYGLFHLPTPFAALLVIGLTSGLNFVILRLWAFSHS
jgi:putative flippase GtrA